MRISNKITLVYFPSMVTEARAPILSSIYSSFSASSGKSTYRLRPISMRTYSKKSVFFITSISFYPGFRSEIGLPFWSLCFDSETKVSSEFWSFRCFILMVYTGHLFLILNRDALAMFVMTLKSLFFFTYLYTSGVNPSLSWSRSSSSMDGSYTCISFISISFFLTFSSSASFSFWASSS